MDVFAQVKGCPPDVPPIPILEGVKQGCPLSPTLFRLFIDRLEPFFLNAIPNAPAHIRSSIMQFGTITIALLLFADDLVFASTSPEGLQWQMDQLASFCTTSSMSVNTDKSKLLVVNATDQPTITYLGV